MTLYFDKLIDRYIPTDSGWNFHPDNTALLSSTEIDSKLVIEATNPLPKDYKQLMYSNISGSGNASVYYLDMITSKDSGTLPTIERDLAASNAKAIKLAPNTTMLFRTNYPYNKDRLKKVLCRCRKAAGATTTLHVGVVGIEDKAYKQPDGTYGNETFYEVTVSGGITDSYVTYVGYILGTDSVENIELVARPNHDPDYPAKLLDGTTDIALAIKTGSGTGDIYVDSIELQDTENALTELPKGALVVNTIEGMSDDNRLTPVEKNYLVTLMSEIIAEYGDEDGTPVIGIYYAGVQAGVSSTLLTTLSTKYHALYDAMYGVGGWLTTLTDITTIDGALFNMLFDEYYAAKTAVQQETANLNNIKLELSSNTSLITVSPRGALRTEEIIFSVNTYNIADLSDIEWKLSYEENTGDGLDYIYLSESVIDYSKRLLNCNTVFVDDFTLSVTYTVGARTYSDSLSISKAIDGNAQPVYQNASATVPVITPEGALMRDDFFLYIGPYLGNGTAPTEEDLEEYRQNGELPEVPASVNNEFIYGRLYKYVGQESAECTVGQTAANSIIISNAAALVYAVGLTVYLNGETARRTITGITTYDVDNKEIALSGAAFDTTTDSLVYIDVWSESRDSKHLSAASADALEIARSSGTWLYCAVLVAQLGLFGELLIENELRSTKYASHMEGSGATAKEVPDMGFKLNGRLGEIIAYALRAYESDIFGNLTASGFKTLQEQVSVTITTASITPTIWKHSDMEALIANQDSLATVSGTIDGYSFTKATRRNNNRILLASHGYEYREVSGGESRNFPILYPSFVFGNSFRCKYSGMYSGVNSFRLYLSNIRNRTSGISSDNTLDIISSTTYTVEKTYILNRPGENCMWLNHTSGAWLGSKGTYVNYHQVWTEGVFTGLVLVNGESYYTTVSLKPTAYYSNSRTWTIGSATQTDYTNYCSGTAFYNLFSSLAIGADGSCYGGQINVNGTLYTVTRLIKGANSITFYTTGGVVTINKFQEGTNVGVYTALAVTQAINFQAVVGGIETKHVLPFGKSDNAYDIGQNDKRFRSGYFRNVTSDSLNLNGHNFNIKQLANDVDFNQVREPGIYRLGSIASSPNAPPGGGWSQMLVLHGGGDTYAQVVIPYNSSVMHVRGFSDGYYSAWRTI